MRICKNSEFRILFFGNPVFIVEFWHILRNCNSLFWEKWALTNSHLVTFVPGSRFSADIHSRMEP